MRGHNGISTVLDSGAKGNQFQRFDSFFRLIQFGKLHVAIFRSVAMAGKVLGRNQDVGGRILMRSFNKRAHSFRNSLGIFTERTRIDDRVIGVVVHVRIRREDPTDSQSPGFARSGSAQLAHR